MTGQPGRARPAMVTRVSRCSTMPSDTRDASSMVFARRESRTRAATARPTVASRIRTRRTDTLMSPRPPSVDRGVTPWVHGRIALPSGVVRMRRAWPALGYAAVFAALGWPWLRTCRDAVPFGNLFAFADDARFWVWQLAWVAHAMATDPWRVLDANIHHPAPAQLTSSEHLASTQLIAVPAVWLTGNPVLVANLVVLASYPLAALAMYGLLVALGCGAAVAWVGGLVFA